MTSRDDYRRRPPGWLQLRSSYGRWSRQTPLAAIRQAERDGGVPDRERLDRQAGERRAVPQRRRRT